MSRKITAEKVDRLEKFFRLMGSDQDGEAISALRMTRRLITDLDMTWNEFVTLLARYLFGFQSHGVEAKAQPERSSDVWDFEGDIDDMLNKAFQEEQERIRKRQNAERYAANMRAQEDRENGMREQGHAENVFRTTGMTDEEWEARGYHPGQNQKPHTTPRKEEKESLQDFLRRVKNEIDDAFNQAEASKTKWFEGASFEPKEEEKKDG